MNKREKYIKASERIVLGNNFLCCTSIAALGLKNGKFEEYFKPSWADYDSEWFGSEEVEENQIARSLALLFMAELDK